MRMKILKSLTGLNWMKYKATFTLIFEDYYFLLNKSHLIVQKQKKQKHVLSLLLTDYGYISGWLILWTTRNRPAVSKNLIYIISFISKIIFNIFLIKSNKCYNLQFRCPLCHTHCSMGESSFSLCFKIWRQLLQNDTITQINEGKFANF